MIFAIATEEVDDLASWAAVAVARGATPTARSRATNRHWSQLPNTPESPRETLLTYEFSAHSLATLALRSSLAVCV
jgi:hypothetical protein